MIIQELILQTNNLFETKTFYNEIIGFEIIEETDINISFAVGTSKLIFELNIESHAPKYHFAFNIPTNKIEDALIWLLKRTDLISSNNSYITNFEDWNAKAIYFFDNNKNILEFISRNDLNNNSDKSFSVETILNINEIGIVNDQPINIANKIIDKVNIDFFSKGPKRADFVALGDENGLFVISNPARNWYPTTQLAEKYKVKAKIKVADKEYKLEFN